MIRVLIVDDEPLAREKIRMLLENQHDIEVIGECGDGLQAVSVIQESCPDLIFLDVQMPELDGFSVLKTLAPEQINTVVFVTAFDEYALKAFEVHALDYLLKPFDRERFLKTLQRARIEIEKAKSSELNQKVLQLLETQRESSDQLDRLAIKSAGRIVFVKIEEIDWIEAAGNYVKLHVGEEMHLHRETMSGMESKLSPDQFLRIHRSTIVNIDRIKEIQPYFNGEHIVILDEKTKLTMSRRNRTKLQERIEQYL
jgi:two-component system LytT family response regulator